MGTETLTQTLKLTKRVVLTQPHGMQLIVATRLSLIAQRFQSKIMITKGSLSVNAKNVIELLWLEAGQGDVLTFEIEGEDAKPAFQELLLFLDISSSHVEKRSFRRF